MQFSKVFFIVLVLIVFSISTNATVWTVDSNPGNHAANFTNVQVAHDDAADGDTIYISGFSGYYPDVTISKKLYIFGPGYFLNENDSTQANTYAATLSIVRFDPGSENSIISGCRLIAHIHTDSITIKRNYIYRDPYYAIYLENNASDIIIKQNYINSNYNAIRFNANHNNINISNNFITSVGLSTYCILGTSNCTNIIVENNILYGGVTLYNAVISNNIFRDGGYTGNSSNSIMNNICNGTQFDTTGNNQQNVNMTTVFVDSGTTDGQWQIDPLGAAAGTGTFGTDIGMFGGITPYILSGIPEIPTIYFFYGPSNASQTLQIQAKIKSRR